MNKQAIKASFSKAAVHYDQFADVQREIGHHLMALIKNQRCLVHNLEHAHNHSHKHKKCHANAVLDLGCGTGYFSTLLNELYKENTQLTCFDLSPKMLQQASLRNLRNCEFIEGDIDALPFVDNQFDVIFSNLVLQWSEQLALSLKQLKQTLNKQGILYFSTLLDGSLFELKQAWKTVDSLPHINEFLTQSQITDALKEAGFIDVKLTVETRVKKYTDMMSVMKALKGIGANHVHNGNKALMTGRQLLQQLEQGYVPYKGEQGLYNLSYQVCYVVAFQGER